MENYLEFMKCKIFDIRLLENYNEQDLSVLNQFLENIKVSRMFSSFVNTDPPFWSILIFYEEKIEEIKSVKMPFEEIILNPEEEEIYDALRKWRNEQANKENLPPYMILHNFWLKKVAKAKPNTVEDLASLEIKGLGKKRIEKYGEEIIKIINSFQVKG